MSGLQNNMDQFNQLTKLEELVFTNHVYSSSSKNELYTILSEHPTLKKVVILSSYAVDQDEVLRVTFAWRIPKNWHLKNEGKGHFEFIKKQE